MDIYDSNLQQTSYFDVTFVCRTYSRQNECKISQQCANWFPSEINNWIVEPWPDILTSNKEAKFRDKIDVSSH